MNSEDMYLKERNGWWHYARRVPKRVQHLDHRDLVRISLKTRSLEIARKRRDILVEADDEYWENLCAGELPTKLREASQKKYVAAQTRAKTLNITYKTMDELTADTDLTELVDRIRLLEGKETNPMLTNVVLGGQPRCEKTVSQALDLFINEIVANELITKSEKQKKSWIKTKRRSIQTYIDLTSDMPMDQITREDALKLYNFWNSRITKGAIYKGKLKYYSPTAGNRELGDMRLLYKSYFQYVGNNDLADDTVNPFRGLRFKDRKKKRASFTPEWIEQKILNPELMKSLNRDARLIIYALIETGCRPSEICNIQAPNIHLDADIPHIEISTAGAGIEGMAAREIKTRTSHRKIPLVGVSLEAFKYRPKGFSRYFDKEDSFSQTALKYFRANHLLPTENHFIYSFRHSYENRLKTAKVDYELRCYLFGHSSGRPDYGDIDLKLIQSILEKNKLSFYSQLFF